MNFQSLKESDTAQRALAYYDSLSARDQIAVKVLGAFMICVIIVFGVILPTVHYNNTAQSHYQASVDTLNWMMANQQRFSGNQQRARQDTGQSLLSVANNSSKTFNISFKRYEPVGDNGLNLWLEGAVFNNIIVWLELLDKRHGVQVKKISVDRQDEKGLVNVRLVLQG